jgi:quinol monooxygenase YgiN
MGEKIKLYQKNRRGFLKSSIASSLMATSAIIFGESSYANDKSKSNEIERNAKMTKKVILEFKVEKNKVKPLMVFLNKNLENVRSFDGCSQVEVYYNPDEDKMIFDEMWESVEQHQKYLGFITENGVMAELASFLASKPEIKYFDIVDL